MLRLRRAGVALALVGTGVGEDCGAKVKGQPLVQLYSGMYCARNHTKLKRAKAPVIHVPVVSIDGEIIQCGKVASGHTQYIHFEKFDPISSGLVDITNATNAEKNESAKAQRRDDLLPVGMPDGP